MGRSVHLVLLISFWASWTVFAAQNAIVIVDRALIRESPDNESAALVEVRRGQVVRVSSEQKDGWHKTVVPGDSAETRFGWIRVEAVRPSETSKELRSAGISAYDIESRRPSQRRWLVSGFYQQHWMRPKALQESFGAASSLVMASSFGGELGYRINHFWTFLGYASPHRLSTDDFTSKGTETLLLLEYALDHTFPLKTSVAMGGGASLSTTVSGSSAFTAPVGLLRFGVHWYFSEWMGLGFLGGARYLAMGSVLIGEERTDVNLSSLFAAAAVRLEF